MAAISRSCLMLYSKSPYHYWSEKISIEKKSSSDSLAMILGAAVHARVMEPDEFSSRYFVARKCDRRTKKGQQEWSESLLGAQGRIILREEDMEKVKNLSDSVFAHIEASSLIHGANYEQSIFWIDKETGIHCKARPDILHKNMVVDLKTTKDASYYIFKKDAIKYGYHLQAAMIQEGIYAVTGDIITDFISISIENKHPFPTAIYTFSDETIEQGRSEFRRLLELHKECTENQEWPSYEIREI